jgi:hypothetical protein
MHPLTPFELTQRLAEIERQVVRSPRSDRIARLGGMLRTTARLFMRRIPAAPTRSFPPSLPLRGER